MNSCSHNLDLNGFCILCGFEVLSTSQLVKDTHPVFDTRLVFLKHTKYTVNHNKHTNKELDFIMDYINLKEYKASVLNEIHHKNFSTRLSFLDKALLSLYHVLKEDNYPIFFSDLQKFTKKPLASAYFKEYGNRNLSEEYIKNVYDRFVSMFYYLESIPTFESYKEIIKTHYNVKIEVLSIGYFLKGRDLEKCYKGELCTIKQLKRIIKKLQKDGCKDKERRIDLQEVNGKEVNDKEVYGDEVDSKEVNDKDIRSDGSNMNIKTLQIIDDMNIKTLMNVKIDAKKKLLAIRKGLDV